MNKTIFKTFLNYILVYPYKAKLWFDKIYINMNCIIKLMQRLDLYFKNTQLFYKNFYGFSTKQLNDIKACMHTYVYVVNKI